MPDPTLTYYGKVINGQTKIFHRKRMETELKQFEGKQIEISVRLKRKRRSLEQNAYYWGVVIPMLQIGLKDAGYKADKEQTHELIKYKFCQTELVNEDTGECIKTIGTTTKLTTTAFCELIADIQQWAAEYLNIQIPSPNEQIEIEFKQQ